MEYYQVICLLANLLAKKKIDIISRKKYQQFVSSFVCMLAYEPCLNNNNMILTTILAATFGIIFLRKNKSDNRYTILFKQRLLKFKKWNTI
jgi:hypothetical protein